jgi:hypothetical protein
MEYFDFEQSYRIRASYRRFGLSHDGRTLIESLVVHWCSQSNMVGITEEGKDSRVPYHGFMYSCFTTKNLASATKKGLDTRGICPRYHTIHHNTSSNDHVTLESYVRFVALYACL